VTDETVVVAIGGNALSPSGESAAIRNQFLHTRESLVPIVAFARDGWRVAIVHGNGPQVGDALLRNECARSLVEELPMGVLVPATAGWIGYMIQQSLQNALARAQIDRRVITVITQTLVDPEDPAFTAPTKPIGRALSPEVAEELRSEGVAIGEDSRGSLRRVVPSPRPVGIPEAATVADLLAAGDIVIACGSGGAPAYYDPNLGLEGVDVIVDKDWAAAILAEQVGARVLLILTNVAGVYDDFGGPGQTLVERLTAAEAQTRLAGDGLGSGSMKPKLAAATHFVERTGGSAVIAALDEGLEALQGRAGTWIVRQ
jgi:carbamate kinase